jgi:hypothetical protein
MKRSRFSEDQIIVSATHTPLISDLQADGQ